VRSKRQRNGKDLPKVKNLRNAGCFWGLLLILMLALCGCKGEWHTYINSVVEDMKTPEMVTMTGRVLRALNDDSCYFLVVDDAFYQMLNGTEGKSFWGLETGDLLEISYDGSVMYSWPMQVRVYDFTKLESGSLADVSQEVITELENSGWHFPTIE